MSVMIHFKSDTGIETAFNSGGSSNNSTPAPSKPSSQSPIIVNREIRVIIAVGNTPQPCPGIQVPPGMAVRIRANNGTVGGNTNVVYVGDYPQKFAAGQGTPLAPLEDILWPVRNTANIWVYGGMGDGVVVSVITPYST
jgi:hypothetical protein